MSRKKIKEFYRVEVYNRETLTILSTYSGYESYDGARSFAEIITLNMLNARKEILSFSIYPYIYTDEVQQMKRREHNVAKNNTKRDHSRNTGNNRGRGKGKTTKTRTDSAPRTRKTRTEGKD